MSLKNRQEFVPEGYWAYVAELNWTSPRNVSFIDGARAIQQKRLANTQFKWATDLTSVQIWLEQYTEKRLRETYGDAAAAQWIAFDSGGNVSPPFTPRSRQHLSAAAVVPSKVEKAKAGIGLLLEWLGTGLTPVDGKTANARALVCSACEFNQEPKGLQAAYEKVADGLKALMSARKEMKLTTNYDDRLETCALCDCRMSLKVFTPTAHIREHTSEAMLKSLPQWCWVKKELTN